MLSAQVDGSRTTSTATRGHASGAGLICGAICDVTMYESGTFTSTDSTHGRVWIIPEKVAHRIIVSARLVTWHQRFFGEDGLLDAVIRDGRDIAVDVEFRRKQFKGNTRVIEREHSETIEPEEVSTTEAGRMLDLQVPSVRRAIERGNLPGARKIGGRWAIPTAAVQRYDVERRGGRAA